MKRIFLLIVCFCSVSAPCLLPARASFADECIDWGKLMTQHEISNMPKGRRTILVQSFDNFTKIQGDDWLITGIPYMLAKYLATGSDINVLYGQIAKHHPSAANPSYAVNGMFQHTSGHLRIFVKLMERGSLKQQFQLDISYPQNRQFFDTIGETALSILAIASPHYDNEGFKQIQQVTSTLPAYENYIRGMMAYWFFDPAQLDIIKTWFDEAKKVDINFSWSYEGMANEYIFMAMHNKQKKQAYGGFLEAAEKEFASMERFVKKPPEPKRPIQYVIKLKEKEANVTNRFLLGNASFVAGLTAADNKKWHEAARYFEETVAYVPEDAITWLHLSKMRDKTGDKHKAAQARAKAFELDKCLQ